jgi:hypothetical protein
MKFTFPVTIEQKRSALHYMTLLAEEESDLSLLLKEESRSELLLALNYILDLIIDDVLRSVRNAK